MGIISKLRKKEERKRYRELYDKYCEAYIEGREQLIDYISDLGLDKEVAFELVIKINRLEALFQRMEMYSRM